MSLTASDVQQQSFGTSRHGYDPQEVDVFLERVATEIDNFTRALVDAKSRVDSAEARALAAEQQAAQAAQVAQQAQREHYAQDAKGAASASATEQQIAKAFIAAQKSADELREESRKESEKAYREAEARARDIVRDALAEKQRILDEVDRLRESAEKFRTEYLTLLNHFSADAKKTLPGIDSIVPDITAEKKATDDANKVLRENDASFQAPEPALTSAPAAGFAAAVVAEAPAAAAGAAQAPVAAEAQTAAVAPETIYTQVSGDFDDDDLDIEEID